MHDYCELTLYQWIGILAVSTRLECDKLRERAIQEIHQHRPRIDPIEKIVLAQKYDVPDWYISSYAAICQRAQPLSPEEGMKVGLTTAILLAQSREAARQEPPPARESTPTTRGGGRGGRANGGRTQATLPQAEPEPRPSTASLWKEWEGLTVPDPEETFDPQRVADIVRDIFHTADAEGQGHAS